MTILTQLLAPWTAELRDAARKEGWDLFSYIDGPGLQVGRIADPEDLPSGVATHLPSDDVAMAMVRCGTGAHHDAARRIIYYSFPQEWERMNAAYAAVFPAPEAQA
jgi:hypothetical protein